MKDKTLLKVLKGIQSRNKLSKVDKQYVDTAIEALIGGWAFSAKLKVVITGMIKKYLDDKKGRKHEVS
jgi:uncharacterized membrane-anchored protein